MWAMFWAFDLNDFLGSQRGQGKYTQINAVKKY